MKHIYKLTLELDPQVSCDGRWAAYFERFFESMEKARQFARELFDNKRKDLVDREEGWQFMIRKYPVIECDCHHYGPDMIQREIGLIRGGRIEWYPFEMEKVEPISLAAQREECAKRAIEIDKRMAAWEAAGRPATIKSHLS